MDDADAFRKRRQVAEVYAGMTDEELRRLAEEAWSLTDIGRGALISELTRRGLNFKLEKSSPYGDASDAPRAEMRDLVLLRQFRDFPEALVAKGVLESAHIECFLADDTTIRMDWLWSNALGGIKLYVKREDAEAAARLLDQ